MRALAVLGVVIFHLGAGWLRGGWLGVDVFFVLSGFLICSLLLAEYRRWQSIDLLAFWLARARRLLPGLVLMVGVVLVVSNFWSLPARRASIALDALATLCYVANWRLLLSDDTYFGSTLGLPSPLRHTWSLAIEEQFYLVFPLLLIAVLALTRRFTPRAPRGPLTTVFTVLAVASALWMGVQYIPGTDPTNVYYSTFTRAFELLIGVIGGIWLGGHDFGQRVGAGDDLRVFDRWIGWVALPAGLAVLATFVVADENASWLFRGGLIVICLLSLVVIAAAAAPIATPVQRVLSAAPLVWLGRLSYSFYLWHWPVIVFLTPDRIGLTGAPLSVVRIAVSLGAAYLSYRFVEQPVHRGGLRALVPSRPWLGKVVACAAVPLLAIALIAGVRTGDAVAAPTQTAGPQISYSAPAPSASGAATRVSLVGNSVPLGLAQWFPAAALPMMQVQSVTSLGCEPWPGKRIIDGQVQPTLSQCPAWTSQWVADLSQQHPDMVIYPVSQAFVNDFEVDGTQLRFGSAAHDAFIERSLDQVRSGADHAGARRFVLLNLSCHRMAAFTNDSEISAINDDAKVRHLNAVAGAWAKRNGVQVLDLFSFLCADGYRDTINGQPLWQDGLHFTPQAAPIVWTWMADQLEKQQ
ncbi:hypothetical protein AZH51_07365 [Branchiibius sp. NY16-3462-2]|nr:hypothetical protein AZH51_07365 [Branchiibius sp. NY16-3462-2]